MNIKYPIQPEEIGSNIKNVGQLRESDTRIIINRQLREADWNPENKSQILTEQSNSDGFADYVLLDLKGRPLAILEAKRGNIDPYSARQQSQAYAESLDAHFIFLANGEYIYFWDYKKSDARLVDSFFTQEDLERRKSTKTFEKPLDLIPIPDKINVFGREQQIRPYQKEAILAVDRSISAGKRKMLLEMATGTGKTITIALIMKRLFETGLISRVLFLVDRIGLADQAENVFKEQLKDYPTTVLYGGKRSLEGRIVIGTLGTIASQLGPNGFGSGYFDLVITDECHRSIYNIYKSVLLFFDALQIGLTATPNLGHYQYKNDIERELVKNTYQFFDCWNAFSETGEPTFSYTLEDGVKDGYLADYDIVETKTKITIEGAQWEGDDYTPNQLERDISFESRNLEMVKEFARIEKDRGNEYPRKTIVFAISKKHASQLTRLFNEVYSQWNGKYAEEITTDVKDPKAMIKRFKNELLPAIAVSVGMLDTGFDAPEVENLIMMRPTQSAILYNQMRGRGSRRTKLTRNHKEYEKKRFLIYDFVGNARNFEDHKLKQTKPSESKASTLKPTASEITYEQTKPMIFVSRDKRQDEILERNFVTVGREGRRIPAKTYWDDFRKDISERENEPVIAKIKTDQEISDKEIIAFTDKMNQPENYFNEENLQTAWGERWVTLIDFVKIALGKKKMPTFKEKLDEAFDAYKLQKNFTPDQLQFAKMLKERSLVDDNIDIEDLNQPPLSRLGGYPKALDLFGEDGLSELFNELNEKVIARIR